MRWLVREFMRQMVLAVALLVSYAALVWHYPDFMRPILAIIGSGWIGYHISSVSWYIVEKYDKWRNK